MKFLSTQTFQCGITVQGSTTLAGTTYLTGITNTASWDYVVVGTSAQGQLFTRTYAQLMSDISSGITLSLDGLSDVVAPTPLTGQLLRYNGVQWANWTPTYYSLPAGGTTLQYIDGTGALQTFPSNLPTSSVKHQVKAGVAINKGQAVYVTGADGTNMIVGLASNASEATSSKTMGLLDATVSTNGFANVVTEGLLAGLDTSTAGAAGDPVWLGTGGNLIYGLINKPYAPAHLVFIGIVTRKNSNNGEIFVKVQNGFELDELHDVDLKTTTPVNGHLLGFNGTLWVNKTIAGWLGYTPANASGTTNYISKFTGSTTLGNSLIYDDGTNVGIGTTSPNSRLSIGGGDNGSGVGVLELFTSGGTNLKLGGNIDYSWIQSHSSKPLRINELGNNVILNLGGGNVGIGTSSPNEKLSVSGTFKSDALWTTISGISQWGAYPNAYGTLTWDTGYARIHATSGNRLDLGASGGLHMTISTSGNIGIGTTSPSTKLHVSTTGNTDGLVQLLNGDSNYGATTRYSRGGNYNWDIGVGAGASNNIPFSYFGIADGGVTPRLVIAHTSGSVGIGTTSPNSSAKLHLSGATTSPSLNTTNPANITAIFSNSDPSYGTMFATDPTGKGLIQQRRTDSATYYDLLLQPYGGNIGIGTASPTTALHVVGTVTATAIQLNTGSGDYYINGSSNTLRIGSLSTTNKIQLELFHSVNPVSLGISYNGGEALPYIESVHPSYDVNTHLLFKPGGTENWRIGSHGSNHIYGSAFAIKPASNNYDFYLANSSGTALFYSDTSTGSIGIGTTSPASRLQIGSVGSTGYSVGNGLAFGDGTRAGALNVDSNGTTLYSSTNLIFSPGTTEAVRITSAGNVGIGTTSPQYKLDVNGSFNALTSGVYLTYNSGIIYHGSSYYQFPSGSYYLLYGRTGMGLIFGSNNAEVGRFDLSGNLGIGTTAPAEKLHVTQNIALGLTGGSIGDTNNILFPTVNGGTHAGVPNGIYYTKKGNWGGQIDIRTSYDWGYSTDNAKISLNGAEGNGITFSTGASALGSTERVRITSDGNVGIGTSTPAAALHTIGSNIVNIVQSTSSVSYTQYYNTSTGAASTNDGLTVGVNGLDAYVFNREISSLILGTADTEAIRITSTQNVGIGTTGPSAKLHVKSSGNSTGTYNLYLTNSSNSTLLYLRDDGAMAHSGPLYQFGVTEIRQGNALYLYNTAETSYSALTQVANDLVFTLSGNVGIGASPQSGFKLDVHGSTVIRGAIYSNLDIIEFSANGNYNIAQSGNTWLAKTSGNVGIGTSSPTTKLDVNGVITATGGNSTNWNTAYGWGNHSSAGYVPQARTLTINGTSYDLSANRSWTIATTTPGGSNTQFQYNNGGSLAGASALTYNSANNRIGVNQASPGYDFDVNGQVRVQDKLRVGTVNSGNGVVHMSSTATINPSATTIVWAQNVSVGMCAFIEYYILNNNSLTDQRAGTIMVTWNQSGTPTIAHTETTTPDIGSTIAVNFTSSLVGSDARINAVNSSANPYTIVMSYKYF
jgi:hypothetical protein